MAIDGQEDRSTKLIQIGIALSSERNLDRLLEMILDLARDLTHADAGTLYLVREESQDLKFEIAHNQTLGTRVGGTSGNEAKIPPVPLVRDGSPNLANVSAYVANTGQLVNIPDVYEAEGFDFTGPRKYDEFTGYRTKSMLCIPMRNHETEIIGVLQLINALDPATRQVIPFASEHVDLTSALASQAAVALTNAKLIQDLKNLFDAIIKSIATAIEEKSPYTGGHIRRVAELTMTIAQAVNETTDGPFAGIHFTPDEMEELRIAAWMHDIGKITTPEHVVDKSTKLEAIVDRIEMIKARFDSIRRDCETSALKKKIDLLTTGTADPDQLHQIDEELNQQLTQLDDDLNFIVTINKGGEFMEDEKLERLRAIARRTYTANGEERPYLTENEVYNLSIKRGTLNLEDRKIIENHALMSIKMLRELPFPKKLKHVPEYAGGHHEKLNGKGYPFGLTADQLSLQARIMAVADIFEALTAHDRPYKKPMPLSKAIQILGFFVKDQDIDKDVVDLFVKQHIFEDYAKREMDPTQIDEVKVQ
ncbi:MAG: GAF domain-containing protein [Candidatus Latescibacteria bacterium]|nr:GAF domain-containing protein [Candidatus Latescibacterota bacterium]